MNEPAKRQGAEIKSYIRAKWRSPANADEVERLGRSLDPKLRARVDAIGMDDQELLQVADEAVLAHPAELEREAEHELTRALNGVRVVGRKRTDARADPAKDL